MTKVTQKTRQKFNKEAPKPKVKRLKKWECPVGGAHYWDIPEVSKTAGKTIEGTCRQCGKTRRFRKTLDID